MTVSYAQYSVGGFGKVADPVGPVCQRAEPLTPATLLSTQKLFFHTSCLLFFYKGFSCVVIQPNRKVETTFRRKERTSGSSVHLSHFRGECYQLLVCFKLCVTAREDRTECEVSGGGIRSFMSIMLQRIDSSRFNVKLHEGTATKLVFIFSQFRASLKQYAN